MARAYDDGVAFRYEVPAVGGAAALPAVTEQTTVMDGGMSVTPTSATGVRLMMAQAAAEVSPLAETSYTIKATIEPASARQNANWSLAWANGSSA